MKVAYVRWLDASFTSDDSTAEELDPRCELEEVGFLGREDKDTISLTMEKSDAGGRVWLNIPRVNITDFRVRELEAAFPESSKRSPKRRSRR